MSTPDPTYAYRLQSYAPRLLDALRPLAQTADGYDAATPDHHRVDEFGSAEITVGDCRRARDLIRLVEGEADGPLR